MPETERQFGDDNVSENPDLHPDAQPPISDEPPIPDDEDLPGTPRPGPKPPS